MKQKKLHICKNPDCNNISSKNKYGNYNSYCSDECNPRTKKKKCKHPECSNILERKSHGNYNFYCSDTCKHGAKEFINKGHKKICCICNSEFYNASGMAIVCSDECRIIHTKNVIKIGEEYKREKLSDNEKVVCLICNKNFRSLTGHLIAVHDISTDQYRKTYAKAKIVSDAVSKILSDNLAGDKNPGWQHGGTLSPWSEKSEKHTPEQITLAKQKAKENMKASDKRDTTLQYYLNQGMSDDEAKKALSERQTTFSLEICIEKYGFDKGIRIFNERQEKWQNTLNDKSPEEIADINSRKTAKSYRSVSTAEMEIFNIIKEIYPAISSQFSLHDTENKKTFIYDIILNNKIIEYNGDFWHANPVVYKEDFVNRVTKKTMKEIHEKDKIKTEYAKLKGYQVLTIWEKDYKENPRKIISNCLEFLNG